MSSVPQATRNCFKDKSHATQTMAIPAPGPLARNVFNNGNQATLDMAKK